MKLYCALIIFCLCWHRNVRTQDFHTYFNLANDFHYQQQFDKAIEYYKKALECNDLSATVYFNLGLTYHYKNDLPNAATCYRKSIELNPSYAKAYKYLLEIACQQKNKEDFKNFGTKALELNPTELALQEKIGLTAIYADELELAYTAYSKLLEQNPTNYTALYNYAYLLCRINKNDLAADAYAKALEHNPSNNQARLGLAKALLACGEFEKGWPLFEARFPNAAENHALFKYNNLQPIDLTNKTVVLRAEWGLGDMTQFVRYAAELKKVGATVIVQSFDPLIGLFSSCPFIDRVVPIGNVLPDADYHIPMLSLPLIFKTTISTIPAPIPYIFAQPELVTYWKEKLDTDTNFKIGICWHAKQIYLEDHQHTKRSIPLAQFATLTDLQHCSFYSLQKEVGTDEIAQLQTPFDLHTFDADFDVTHGRFADTAAVIMNMDLVISADTSIVHLAGALGKTVWVLLPYAAEWRWLPNHPEFESSPHTPWYPNTLRLFKQKEPGNWHAVLNEVKDALQQLVEEKRSR